MAKNFLKKLTSKKKKSTSKSEKKDSSTPKSTSSAPNNPVPLPVIGRHRVPTTPTGTRSSITIGANRTPQAPPLTSLQKWTPGTKNGSPTPGPALIGRGRGTSAPTTTTTTTLEEEKAPYNGVYTTFEQLQQLARDTDETWESESSDVDDDKDSGPYNNKYTTVYNPEKAPYTANYSHGSMNAMLFEDDKDSGPYNNYGVNAPYKTTVIDDDKPVIKYGTAEDIDAILEADDDSDYDSDEDDDYFYQNLDNGLEQKDETAPQPPRAPVSKETPAVRTHRAWLIAQLSKDYEAERIVQRPDLAKAASGLAREIKLWWDLIEELELVVESEPDELETALDDAPDGHPIRDITNLADAIEMAKRVHANKLEMARRQELPVTEDGELGDISGRLVTYDDKAAQERSLVLVGGNKLYRNDDKKTPVDTKQSSTFHSGLGAEIFVVGMGNDIHMASHKIGKFHHSSLLGGANVSMGGEMQVTDGKIDWVSNKSGHYMPSVVQFQQFLHHLGKDVPLTFPVMGWGVPKGVTAQQLVDGVNEDGKLKEKKGHDYQKTQALLTAWKELVGKPAMKKVMQAKGWTLDKWDGEWEVEDANYQAVPPQSVRQAMKDAFPDKKPVGEK